MAMDRLTWFGLMVAALGWVLLIADAAFSPFFLNVGNMAAVVGLRSDIFSIAETTIVSGFALAILGALRAGFGALSKFFDAVLERSTTPRKEPVAMRTEPEIMPVAPHTVVEHVERPPAQPHRSKNYVILPNGAVEVETLLGTKVFASLDEARDYIR